jgi:lipopolysaccharide export system protein LptC
MNRIHADILVDGKRFEEAIQQHQKSDRAGFKLPHVPLFFGSRVRSKGMYDESVKEYTISSSLGTVLNDELVKTNEVYTKRMTMQLKVTASN